MDYIRQTGYTTLWGTPCVYIEDGSCITVIPQDENTHIVEPPVLWNKEFEFDYGKAHGFLNTALIFQNFDEMHYGRKLTARYVFKNYRQKLFDSMTITGDLLDDFFEPAKYFLNRSKSGTLPNGDLLYGNETVDSWDIIFEQNTIHIELLYGEILARGLASDLKLHPILTIDFPQTSDIQYIYRLYSHLLQFFRIVRYNPNCGKLRVKMFVNIDGKRSGNGFLIDYSEEDKKCGMTMDINYDAYTPYMARLLSFAFSDEPIFLEHYPQNKFRGFLTGFTSTEYMNLFSAFECECHAKPALYEAADDSRIQSIKDHLLAQIKEFPADDLSPDEKGFLTEAKSRITQIGKQFGQKKKLEIAYQKLNGALVNSLEHLMCNPQFKSGMPENALSAIAKNLVDLRGAIVHGDFSGTIPKESYHIVHFLEVLTYAMLMKRIGLSDEEIELVIGLVFRCNYIYMSHLFGDSPSPDAK